MLSMFQDLLWVYGMAWMSVSSSAEAGCLKILCWLNFFFFYSVGYALVGFHAFYVWNYLIHVIQCSLHARMSVDVFAVLVLALPWQQQLSRCILPRPNILTLSSKLPC